MSATLQRGESDRKDRTGVTLMSAEFIEDGSKFKDTEPKLLYMKVSGCLGLVNMIL